MTKTFFRTGVGGAPGDEEKEGTVLQSSHFNQPNCLIKPYYERVNNRLRWRDGRNGSYPTQKRPTASFSSFLRFILLILLISRILFSLLGRPRSLDDGVDPPHALYYSSGRAIANCWLFSLSRGKQQLNTKDSKRARDCPDKVDDGAPNQMNHHSIFFFSKFPKRKKEH